MGKFTGKKCRLISMFWLTTLMFLVEIVVGYLTNSMALVADSFHMLSDVAALVVAFISVKMSPKKWSRNTFGWARAEVLGALVNAVFLVALCLSIIVEACNRFFEKADEQCLHPSEDDLHDCKLMHNPKMILIVGVVGLVVNVIGLFLFHDHGSAHGHSHGGGKTHAHLPQSQSDESAKQVSNKRHSSHTHGASHMNMRGVFLHVLADALGSVIVIVSAAVVWLTDWEYRFYMDPALSLVLVVLILNSVWPLLKESALILLQTVPSHIQVDALQKSLLEKVDGLLAVHEFHVWQLAGDRIIASVHISCRCQNFSEYAGISKKVKDFFHDEGIHSTTIQLELTEYPGDALMAASQNAACILDCPKPCTRFTCCGPSNKQSRDTPALGGLHLTCNQGSNLQQVNGMENGHLLGTETVDV